MKSAIMHFYNLNISELFLNQYYYFYLYDSFFGKSVKYVLYDVNELSNEYIENVYNLSLFLNDDGNGNLFHKIVKNKYDEVTTSIDDNKYVLLKCYNYSSIIDFYQVLNFSYYFSNENISDMFNGKFDINMWVLKNDFIADTLFPNLCSYEIICESFNYFFYLGELAICLYNFFFLNNNLYVIYSLCHKRIGYKSLEFDFYNPFNLTFDISSRDISEYLKSYFFEGCLDDYSLIFNYINVFFNYGFSLSNYVYFFIRLLYPTYYYDILFALYDNILDKNVVLNNNIQFYLDNILYIVSRIDEFECVLKYVNEKLTLCGFNISLPL